MITPQRGMDRTHARFALRGLLLVLSVVGAAVADRSVGSGGASAYQPRVVIYDNDATTARREGRHFLEWGFAPNQLIVMPGDVILFENPATNSLPHAVTSITWRGVGAERTLESGTRFNSSPTVETLMKPGESWRLDTAGFAPGFYLFYCWPHPWMTGAFFVAPPP